ncbi:hypothetical protein PMAYCL1PPCAC_10380, partial [Pristionchus mayeri]
RRESTYKGDPKVTGDQSEVCLSRVIHTALEYVLARLTWSATLVVTARQRNLLGSRLHKIARFLRHQNSPLSRSIGKLPKVGAHTLGRYVSPWID